MVIETILGGIIVFIAIAALASFTATSRRPR